MNKLINQSMNKILLIALCIFFTINLSAEKKLGQIFVPLENIKINIKNPSFSGISSMVKVPDGYILLVMQRRKNNMLVKIDKKGNVKVRYNKVGNGPGELRGVFNIVVTKTAVLACERVSPYVHEFSHDLIFKGDHRIKKGGKLFIIGDKYAAVWRPNYKGGEKITSIDTVALYDLKNFNFIKTTFPVTDVPALFQYCGGVCPISSNTFAGIYPTEYKIHILDKELQKRHSLIDSIPDHIKKYTPSTQNPRIVDQKTIEWSNSWSVMDSIHYIDNKFILGYIYNRGKYFDILDGNGKVLFPGYQMNQNVFLAYVENQKYLWCIQRIESGSEDEYHLLKYKLKT